MEGQPLHLLLAQPHHPRLPGLIPNHPTHYLPTSRLRLRVHRRKPKQLAAVPSRRPPGSQADAPGRSGWERVPNAVAALVLQLTDFVEVQGKRLKFSPELRANLDGIFSEMSQCMDKGQVQPKSAMAADVVSLGDSWLGYAIRKGLLEPVKNAEEQDWFRSLSDRWKVHLCRNQNGEADPNGTIWGVPYRWGTMVIAYKKNKFKTHNLKPIQDWEDLWRPELAGRISMVDSPREVIGAVLKHLGSSYNTVDMEMDVNGGREAVLNSFTRLQKQVQLFDSMNYLKSFSVGDVWVAVGWSSDVIPAAKRMSNVAVVVPMSGSSLWADLWAIPCATRFQTDQIGSRTRGPSPLIHQWFDFCLQSARSLPFRQDVIPEHLHCTLRTLCQRSLKIRTRGSRSWTRTLSTECLRPRSWRDASFWNPLVRDCLSGGGKNGRDREDLRAQAAPPLDGNALMTSESEAGQCVCL
ncbi:unnamed protein product [Miscanthus lutarioriparius]|uniref:Uncharacterized protein n=1 Tax=Miscanthus lutarioriparius TaxID=422564 RepID=A0A811QS99_9POAL|nr:unnamed protein product [Miscanthus lutarioriparius]